MVTNGLTDYTGDADACEQVIHISFDFWTSGITSLQRLNRSTGEVEVISTSNGLTYSNGLYHLDLTLSGGTGDLFKYNTGGNFVGIETP